MNGEETSQVTMEMQMTMDEGDGEVEFMMGDYECGETGNEEQQTHPDEFNGVGEGDDDDEALMVETPPVEEILRELTEFASNLLMNYRQLEEEGDIIQAELDELNHMQEERCQKMITRLQHAGSSIYAFDQMNEEVGVGDVEGP